MTGAGREAASFCASPAMFSGVVHLILGLVLRIRAFFCLGIRSTCNQINRLGRSTYKFSISRKLSVKIVHEDSDVDIGFALKFENVPKNAKTYFAFVLKDQGSILPTLKSWKIQIQTKNVVKYLRVKIQKIVFESKKMLKI